MGVYQHIDMIQMEHNFNTYFIHPIECLGFLYAPNYDVANTDDPEGTPGDIYS